MKKVLIITYYWPPAGGPGVQRWLKFVKYLPEFDVEPIVYIPENPHYPIQDTSLMAEIPQGVPIYKYKIFEPYRLAGLLSSKKTKRISSGIIKTKDPSVLEKAMLWIRGNFFIPDARKFWVGPSVKFLSELIVKEQIETIITTGPPHSVHLIGQQLKEKHNVKWVTDFRDPWTSIGYHKKLRLSAVSQKKHKKLERSVLNAADQLIVTSETTKKEFEQITNKPIAVITNGYDTGFKGKVDIDKSFTIAHVGSLLTGRNPENLWRALSQLASENAVFRNELQLDFLGVVSQDVMESLNRYELMPYVKLKGYVSHAQAVRRQQGAQVLLLVEIDSEETAGIIPGKIFEYMAAKRPILAIGPKNWEVRNLINETQTGEVFDYKSTTQLKNVLLDWFKAYKKGALTVNSKNIEKYSRKELTRKLAQNL
ncbi:glycosyltransferase family 4 protein [Kriegella aquimaris]|uniref:Glycosyltransferase involved in cell wall bisynthesis n=1 Tax=Kriegella aquimaris TaxID=192904 RepID=A0A1G9NJ78_9FLAO|nr:glycosyltransferase family 4 protein [Kriegella aquimaris]SDL86025.1 Glycosyltransferase involved in cell wall bisynthesis [Kriegella aquimaris]